MQTANGNQNMKSNNPIWYLIGDYSLSKIASDNDEGDELRAGFLFQPSRNLGIQPECIKNIEMTLEGFIRDALLVHYKQTRLELPWRIRVFCQKKLIDDANSAHISMPVHAEQTLEHASHKNYSGTVGSGGWGYFIIGRSGCPAGSSEIAYPLVDLYLYKEGE